MSPILAEHSRTLIERRKLKFDILRDPGNDIAHTYGLRWTLPGDLKEIYLQFEIDLAASNGDDSWTLPIPGRFIIDQAGTVRYARIDPDYTRRPEPSETLDALKHLT